MLNQKRYYQVQIPGLTPYYNHFSTNEFGRNEYLTVPDRQMEVVNAAAQQATLAMIAAQQALLCAVVASSAASSAAASNASH